MAETLYAQTSPFDFNGPHTELKMPKFKNMESDTCAWTPNHVLIPDVKKFRGVSSVTGNTCDPHPRLRPLA